MIRRDGEGNVKAGPLEEGMTVKLPDNPLVRDIQTLLEKNPDPTTPSTSRTSTT